MPVNVVVYDKLSSRPIREFVDGVVAAGDHPILQNPNVWDGTMRDEADCIVLNGLNEVMSPLFRAYRSRNVPIFVVEQGHIGRPAPLKNMSGVHYWQLGPERLNWLPPFPCPDDRRAALGVQFPGTHRVSDGPILFLGQKPGDAQTWNENVYQWHSNVMAFMREFTDRAFVYRPHPLDKTGKLPCHARFSVQDTDAATIEEALDECYATVTFNSNAGIKALLRGVPVFCDPRAIYAEACKSSWSEIEKPYSYDEAVWTDLMNRLCYAQWNTAEMASGEAWQWVKQAKEREDYGTSDAATAEHCCADEPGAGEADGA